MIRLRELGWHSSPPESWQQHFPVGHTLQAIVIAHGEPVELSLRFAEHDPWQDVAERLKPGTWVAGVVTGIAGYGAFVELEPGVTGLLHQSQLPQWIQGSIYDLFWVGDHVQVEVTEVDPGKRTVGLSMKSVAEQRWQHGRQRLACPPSALVETSVEPGSNVVTGARAILLIEEDPAQNEIIENWLRNAGYKVESAPHAARGLEIVHTHKPEIVLTNWPRSEGAGAELLQYILAPPQPMHCVLMIDWSMIDWSIAAQHEQQMDALAQQGVTFLNKPLLPQELLEALAAPDAQQNDIDVYTSHPMRSFREQALVISGATFYTHSSNSQSGTTHPSTTAKERTSTQQAIQASLLNVRRQTGASTAVLFELEPQQRQVHVVAHKGKEMLHRSALGDLIHSPVRDVAEDELTVQVGDAERSATYVRYLRPLLHFHACVGVPVPGNLPQRHALFLFSRRAGFIGNAIVRDATATATVLGALLEQGAFLERAADMQSAIMLGHLSRALVHETNHQLSPILFALNDLERQCGRVADTVDHAPQSLNAQMETAQRALHQLGEHVQKLVNTTHLFSRLTVQNAPTMVRLDSIIDQCIALMRDTADRARVSLYFQPRTRLITTLLKESQVQQVLLNVLLNAIQQIALYRPQEGGCVSLHMEINQSKVLDTAAHRADGSSDTAPKVIRIVVEDDGPGIHQRLWKRIFDLGFTTRQGEGSGLGLFLSQRLIEDNGGSIYVQDSSIGWGTRMAIELPIQFS